MNDKVDIAELHRRGQSEDIGRGMDQGEPMRPGATFERFSARVASERTQRLENAKDVLPFGVKFLDAALGGIVKSDVVLIGAKTGIGKTELSRYIAMYNAARGKRVHFLALEAEINEIEQRTKYTVLADMVYRDKSIDPMQRLQLNYMDWYLGRLDDLTKRHEQAVDKILAEQLTTLHTLYRVRDFTVNELERKFDEIAQETDLVVIDHLHYIDTPDPNENRGYKVIIKRVRDLALNLGKPVIVVAHLRKSDRARPTLVPETDDFHGTSDVPKMATKAIMLAPARDRPSGARHIWNTYIAPVKCRIEGSRTRYVAVVPFDATTNSYQDSFVLGQMVKGGTEFEPLPDEQLPAWARQ
jgi:replicative DNA helicase